jgi:tetratricopeptide (TPR) repeat protein
MATEHEPSISRATSAPRPPAGNLWQVPLFLTGVVALLVVALTRPHWSDLDKLKLERDLSLARQLLEQPGASIKEVPDLVVDALGRIQRFPSRLGEAHFLLGSAYVRLAETLPPERSQDLWQKARFQLGEAERVGVPEPDRLNLAYRLGKAWYHSAGDPGRAIYYLTLAIDRCDDDRGAGYAILSQAYCRLPQPDLKAALEANEKLFEQPRVEESALVQARLLRGELLLGLQDRAGARRALALIGADAPAPIVLRARQLQAQSYQDDQAWAEAAAAWEQLRADPRLSKADLPRLLYHLGWCYRNLGRNPDAARTWESAVGPGDEGQAASLRLADLRLEGGDSGGAIELFGRALAGITVAAEYHNPLLDRAEARHLLEKACRRQRDGLDGEAARQLALLHARLAPPDQGQNLVGEVAEARAKAKRAAVLVTGDREAARQQEEAAQGHFREAAVAFEAAAEVSGERSQKARALWRAGNDYLLGHDFVRAVPVLERYIKLPPPAERLGQAWYRLGEAHQALRNRVAASESFRTCIGLPGPFAYRARFQLAQAESEQGHLADAEEGLRHNLDLINRNGVDPEAHEKSLYALAALVFQRGDYRAAASYWELALPQYPAAAGAWEARFKLGTCYRRLADLESQSLRPGEASVPTSQDHYRKHFFIWLEKAGAQFQKLTDDLQARQKAEPLTAAEATLLRDASFALAECRFEQRHYDEAIRLYNGLAQRYRNQVDELIAIKQIYRSYVVPYPPDLDKARATLQRAHFTLNSMEDSAFTGRPGDHSKKAWEKWLKDAQQELSRYGS